MEFSLQEDYTRSNFSSHLIMASQDLFSSGQKTAVQRCGGMETPSTRVSRATTPSQSPTRSVKHQSKSRRSRFTQPKMDFDAQVNRSVAWNVISKRLLYDLRSLRPRKDTTKDDIALWRQYGIECIPIENSKQKTLVMDDNRKDGRVIEIDAGCNGSRCKRFSTIIGLNLLVLLSSFLGAFLYAYFINKSFVVEEPSSVTNTHSSDVGLCRSWQEDETIHRLENSVMHLANELKTIKYQIKQESKLDVVTQPSRSIIEELFTDEPDLAAAGNFGTVLATPDTRTYTYPILYSFFCNMLRISLETHHRPPQTTIQGLIRDVGDCWAFSGERGRLVLTLHQPSVLVRVSLSHIPSSLSVTGAVDSAPRRFLVLAHYSKEDLDSGVVLGDFEYVREGPWRQVFTLDPLVVKEQLFGLVEFRFLTNNGHPSYTCVYRVHVHGRMYF